MDSARLISQYHQAWTKGDMAAARTLLADDLDFQGSIETYDNADDFVAALAMFQQMLTGVSMIYSFYADSGAALLYDCATLSPAGVIRTAEFFTLRNGKIQTIRLVFDATELRKLMAG